MQVKFINTETLTSQIVNVKFGTLEQVLEQAKVEVPDFNITTNVEPVGSIFKCGKFIGDIVYYGTCGDAKRGRVARDWTEERQKLMSVYSSSKTVKQLSVLSGLSVGQVYYLCKMDNLEYKKGQRGCKKRK